MNHVGMKNGEVYNGADDDGSGTVALLEIAQAIQRSYQKRTWAKTFNFVFTRNG